MIFFIILVVFWGVLFTLGMKETFYNHLFAFMYGLMPLIGGLAAIKGYRSWGGLSTILGKSILFIGLGLFLWGCGETIWAYYNFFLHIELPYPSAADFLFVPSVFSYTIGTIMLSMTTGARMGLKNTGGKIIAVVVSALVLVMTYYMIVVIGNDGVLLTDKSSIVKSILDILYPLGAAVSLAVSLVVAGLSFRYLGGTYKHDVTFILLGLATMFAADSHFSYYTTLGTKYNGDIGDIFFTLALFLLTCGLLGFNKIRKNDIPVRTS